MVVTLSTNLVVISKQRRERIESGSLGIIFESDKKFSGQ